MSNAESAVRWNDAVRLVLSDVDETIAGVYQPADPAMIAELSSFLNEGGRLFLVTGGGLGRVQTGVTDKIAPELRSSVLIAHCSGAEVRGFTASGDLRPEPFYSMYEATFTPEQKQLWRSEVQELLQEFKLRPHPVRPVLEFIKAVGTDPRDIMFDDRGPQITLEMVNAYDLTDTQIQELGHEIPETHGSRDLRIPLLERAEQLFIAAGLPVSPRLGGTFALDLAVQGVSKTTAIQHVLENPDVLATIGLKREDLRNPQHMEIWGDKFSRLRGGTDRHMSEALPPLVRAIDFRPEDPAEFLPGYNIVIWNGQQHLHHGLLEYLQSRRR